MAVILKALDQYILIVGYRMQDIKIQAPKKHAKIITITFIGLSLSAWSWCWLFRVIIGAISLDLLSLTALSGSAG
ncbi:hypothetical protein KUCAC02_030126 [Chaenocephalus aceratus]|uniref:Uncharacterized protein n=1 Tax=Chaenocephalus aceratus TaxID=36190 RepID=A0ACB9XJ54_CHAAC|nr:hypothetical protein KUCAC02_030126 [Chaenocephalus aceratus]